MSREYLTEQLIFGCENVSIEHSIVHYLQKIRQYARVYILTENMDCLSRITIPSHSIRHEIDGVMNSFDFRRHKIDILREISLAARSQSSRPKPVHIVDDSIDVIRVGQRAGMIAHHTSSPRQTSEILKGILFALSNREEAVEPAVRAAA
jgi:hypothetical protein